MKNNAGSYILSVPSWVIPGTYTENLRFLEDKKEIQGVELLFFIYDDEIKSQLASEWDEIRRYRERFVFTAHLPERLLPAHQELVERLTPLARYFIVHPSKENPSAQAKLLSEWESGFGAVFLAENTNPGLLDRLLPHVAPNSGLCMDTGHLLLEGENPAAFLARYPGRIGEIHLHGVDREQAAIDGRLADHRRLRSGEAWLSELFPLLKDYRGIINLEVFSWEEAKAGVEILQIHS